MYFSKIKQENIQFWVIVVELFEQELILLNTNFFVQFSYKLADCINILLNSADRIVFQYFDSFDFGYRFGYY